jgi:membrane fusion protein, peptide pheromone/bacteriocin exporter
MERIFPPEVIRYSAEVHFHTLSRRTQVIYCLILCFIAGSLVSLFLIKTEITVLSRGLLRSQKEPVPITIPVNAEIIKSSIKEDRFVYAGDTLLWLNKEKLDKRIDYLQDMIRKNNAYLKDLVLLLDSNSYVAEPGTNLFKRSKEEYLQQISRFNTEIIMLEKKHSRATILFDKKVISRTEKEEKEFQLARKRNEKEVFIKLTHNKWQQLAENYIIENEKYNNEITGLKEDIEKYILLAPHSGYISNSTGVLPGNFIMSGKVVGVIQPADSLISEHLVTPKDIGYLRQGMNVMFQIDAYDHNQWGMATGKIINISRDIYMIDNQPFFKIKCEINEKYLALNNGYQGKLKKGLTTTARFIVTERTLAQLLFDKTDNWFNPNILSP